MGMNIGVEVEGFKAISVSAISWARSHDEV
jgi:hypothetical protein